MKNDVDLFIMTEDGGYELYIPDAPSEWMAVSESEYVNVKTGMNLWFDVQEDEHVCEIYSAVDNLNSNVKSHGPYADAWARMVGHSWEGK